MFIIDIHSKLQPDPNKESAVLLRAILITLNQSAIPSETPAVPPVQGNPSSEIVTVTGFVYASFLISLLVAFIAMLGKRWVNRYLRNSGGSMIDRCRDRQRKCDGLEKWQLHIVIDSLPVMLQVSLLLFACGLCRHMWSINTSVAYILTSLTSLGVLFYIAILVAGVSSYACPFQTPASIALRGAWKKVQRVFYSFTVRSERMLLWTRQKRNLPAQQLKPWLKPKGLVVARRTNTGDAHCVSWILKNITDLEALDAAVRLAGTIR